MLDGNAVQLIDLETGELRPSTRADLERAVRLADALDPISVLCPPLSAADCAPRMQPIVETVGPRGHFIRGGRRVEVPTFLPEDYETIELPDPIGEMEAFVAGGGTSTMPWTFEGKLETLWNKTLRWPGHFAQWKAYMDAGLLEERPIEVDGLRISPREVLHTLLEPKIKAGPEERDFVVVRVVARGTKDGKPCQVLTELIDHYDPDTGFTAMERTTGWDAAIKAIMSVRGDIPRGVHPAEISVPSALYVEELRRRGFAVRESFDTR